MKIFLMAEPPISNAFPVACEVDLDRADVRKALIAAGCTVPEQPKPEPFEIPEIEIRPHSDIYCDICEGGHIIFASMKIGEATYNRYRRYQHVCDCAREMRGWMENDQWKHPTDCTHARDAERNAILARLDAGPKGEK